MDPSGAALLVLAAQAVAHAARCAVHPAAGAAAGLLAAPLRPPGPQSPAPTAALPYRHKGLLGLTAALSVPRSSPLLRELPLYPPL